MDTRHFDELTRALSEAGTRRGLLGLLATLPFFGGLAALLANEETDAKGRHTRRKRRHQHRKGDGKQNRKGKRKGQHKTESCDGVLCDACETCQDGACTAPCDGAGCCAGNTCLAGTDASACGTGGAACVACSGTTPICAAGSCVACSATNPCPGGLCCAGGQCGTSCPTCQTCTSGQCQPVANNTIACDGTPLESVDEELFCAANAGIGICVDGACACPSQVYDPTNSNRCLCDAESAAQCAANPPGTENCCIVGEVCTDNTYQVFCGGCP